MSVIVNPAAGGAIGGPIIGGAAGSVLFINPNAVLAQDNANFFWDDSLLNLKIGHLGGAISTYFANGSPALYKVPNINGDNWFENGAGNTSLTGYNNFGTGPNTLKNLTSGHDNTAFGAGAAPAVTSGINNTAIGSNALAGCISNSNNFVIGSQNLRGSNVDSNIAIGSLVFDVLGTTVNLDQGNVGIGVGIYQSLTSGVGNIAIGNNISSYGGTGEGPNVLIGTNILSSTSSASFNTIAIGPNSLKNVTSATYCTMLGTWGGPSAAINGIIAINDGFTPRLFNIPVVEWNYTRTGIWSFHQGTNAQGLNVYNTWDDTVPTTNYERFCFDWSITANVARIAMQAGGTGISRIIAIDGFQKAGAPAAGDIPAGTWGLINDTTGNATWLVYNNAGTIRKVQLV